MIYVTTFVTDTLNTVDAVIGNFVSTAYLHFVQANAGMITLLFTVYVMFLGYQFLNPSHHFNLGVVMKHLIVMLCVYALVMNWNLYHLFIYKVFTTEPGNIAQILIGSGEHAQTGETIAQALDEIYSAIIDAAIGFLRQINFSAAGMAFILYAILVFLIGSLMCIFALLLFIYAKMMMAVTLALGPIFILFILWNPTKGLFSAWLNKLITIALVPIVTSSILVLMLSVIHVTLPAVRQPIENQQFYGIAPFLGLSLATTLILSQVFRICSSLGGGITLTSISTGGEIAEAAVERSGVAPLGRSIWNWSRDRMNRNRRNTRGRS